MSLDEKINSRIVAGDISNLADPKSLIRIGFATISVWNSDMRHSPYHKTVSLETESGKVQLGQISFGFMEEYPPLWNHPLMFLSKSLAENKFYLANVFLKQILDERGVDFEFQGNLYREYQKK